MMFVSLRPPADSNGTKHADGFKDLSEGHFAHDAQIPRLHQPQLRPLSGEQFLEDRLAAGILRKLRHQEGDQALRDNEVIRSCHEGEINGFAPDNFCNQIGVLPESFLS